jgi:hypothetical protein
MYCIRWVVSVDSVLLLTKRFCICDLFSDNVGVVSFDSVAVSDDVE